MNKIENIGPRNFKVIKSNSLNLYEKAAEETGYNIEVAQTEGYFTVERRGMPEGKQVNPHYGVQLEEGEVRVVFFNPENPQDNCVKFLRKVREMRKKAISNHSLLGTNQID